MKYQNINSKTPFVQIFPCTVLSTEYWYLFKNYVLKIFFWKILKRLT